MNVVLKHSGRWLRFSEPIKILQADRLEDVQPLLHEAENSGLYAAGFISYEAATAFDAALKTKLASDFPLLCLGLFEQPEVLEDIEKPEHLTYSVDELRPSISKEGFTVAIEKIKEQIAAGATYQVNYTYRLHAGFSGDAWAFFYELVKGQRTEHAAFIEMDSFTVCSASPELFFSYNKGTIVSRPMKGTARRGRTFAEDWKQSEALQHSEKDRAENIMVVDMIRNDIGRIATPGSVESVSCYDVEKYPTVWQMTSTVKGESTATVSDVMMALFPCASITGAPKTKTMEIIRELETSPRNIYTGSVGFITPNAEAFFNVAIRTALIDQNQGTLEFGVGGGIVWDSNADAEYEETLTKARVLTQPRPDFQLLETMLWEPDSGIFLLDEHLQRLGKSAAYFDIPLDMHAVFQALEDVAESVDPVPHRIRLLVSRDGNSELQLSALSFDTQEELSIVLATEPVNSQDIFLFHKTTHRSVYEQVKAQYPDCDDVLLWNENGEVTEGCIANVVIRIGDKLITPPVACGLLAGTFRDHLLKSGEVEEGIVSIEMLKSADEIFLINSVRKWMRARFAE